jgi:phage terminase large subunit-like protein
MIDERRAQEPIDFISCLHLTGDFYGRPFVLRDWQKEFIRSVYGTVKENGYRQYQYAYLEIPKKNGKTETTAALAIYHLVCDGPGGQIYCCAAEREQAALVYKAAKQMIEQDEELELLLNVVDSKKEIHNRETGTFLKVLSAEAYSKHGVNPTVVIFDELHAQQKRDLWDYMTFGAGSARKEPLWWVITTAGDDPDHKSIGWEIHEQALRIRDGEIEDPTWYVKIYGAPEDADIYDEAVWFEVNPNLGISIDIEKVREEAQKAKNNPANEKLFRWLRLNQWVQLKRVSWLPVTMWDATEKDWQEAELRGKRCYVGIDLARWIDLAAAVPFFPPQDGIPDWRFIIQAWMPEDRLKWHIDNDGVDYGKWADAGLLDVTKGSTIDYGRVRDYIVSIDRMYNVQYYCGDPWHLEILKQLCGEQIARKFIEIPQTISGMSPGMSELERQFRAGEISHRQNALGRYCFDCVVVNPDGNENIKPMKNKAKGRIDPICALVNAASAAIRLEQKRSVYEERGMRSLGS